MKAESNIDPGHAFAWGANIGWTNWRPSDTDGARIGEFVCSGFVYGPTVGWINLGDGKPVNGIYYQNDSAADFGVNHDQQGRLWGLAYGANIGWIHFETNGAPRIDLRTGKLSGQVYGANVGWINLGDSQFLFIGSWTDFAFAVDKPADPPVPRADAAPFRFRHSLD